MRPWFLVGSMFACHDPAPVSAPVRPNFVVFLSDDQRWDTLWAMPTVADRLVAEGAVFDNAIVPTPLCCPSRASLLSGGYFAHNTGVLANTAPDGGVGAFVDDDTLATALQQDGYRTGLIGKYFNEYEQRTPYVPPGWSRFLGVAEHDDWTAWSVVEGRSADEATAGIERTESGYITDWQGAEAAAFVSEGGGPFFLYVSFVAPHEPHTPAPGDETLYSDYAYRGRAWDEEDLSDKPYWLQDLAPIAEGDVDVEVRGALQSLMAVDRAVAAVMSALETSGELEDTWIVFTSDNGLLWGEHRLWGKTQAYEESIRVPLVWWRSGMTPIRSERLVAMNLDVPQTIFDLANLERPADGASLVPLLAGEDATWRDTLPLENWENGVWVGLRTDDWKYVEYGLGPVELYDLQNDPYELQSLHGDAAQADRIESFAAEVDADRPLALISTTCPLGAVGVSYAWQLASWGGTPPIRWSILDGQLPSGLSLSEDGWITGVPEAVERNSVLVAVEDGVPTTFGQAPLLHAVRFTVETR
jgi:arylsulfatase A-like enzyme